MSARYLRFWGVRGSYAAPHITHLGVGGNTSCVELRADGHVLIFDGGTGIIPLGEQLITEPTMPNLLVAFTHYHWDHICGLPFFQPAFSPKWNIKFFGPGDSPTEIEQRLSNQMKAPYFPVEIETWAATIDYVAPHSGSITHGPFQMTYHNVHHPGVTYGYRVEVGGRSIVYMSDNEIDFLKSSIAKRTDEFSDDERQIIAKMAQEERRAELDAVRNADILIHDSQYSPADYARKRGWGHSCYVDTVNFAIEAKVKVLYLYHHDPTYNDDQVAAIHRECESLIRQRGSSLLCYVAREGTTVPL